MRTSLSPSAFYLLLLSCLPVVYLNNCPPPPLAPRFNCNTLDGEEQYLLLGLVLGEECNDRTLAQTRQRKRRGPCLTIRGQQAKGLSHPGSPAPLTLPDSLPLFPLAGLAVYNRVLLDFPLPLVLYKKLLGLPVLLRDLEDMQPTIGRSLRALLQVGGHVCLIAVPFSRLTPLLRLHPLSRLPHPSLSLLAPRSGRALPGASRTPSACRSATRSIASGTERRSTCCRAAGTSRSRSRTAWSEYEEMGEESPAFPCSDLRPLVPLLAPQRSLALLRLLSRPSSSPCPCPCFASFAFSPLARYVERVTDFLLNRSIKKPFEAFASGFRILCDGPAMRLFNAQELERMVCGNPNLDFAALQNNSKYEGGYNTSTPVVQWLWSIVQVRGVRMG